MTVWLFRFELPLTFPHLHYVNVPSKVGCVFLCLFQKFGHRFTVQRIRLLWLAAIRAPMEVNSHETDSPFVFRTPPIDESFAYTFFTTFALMAAGATGCKRHRSLKLCSHLSIRLDLLWLEPFLFTSTRVPPGRHTLHQGPQVQRVGVVTQD